MPSPVRTWHSVDVLSPSAENKSARKAIRLRLEGGNVFSKLRRWVGPTLEANPALQKGHVRQIAAGWNPFLTASVTKLLVRFDSETNPASAAQRRHMKAQTSVPGRQKWNKPSPLQWT